MSIAAVNKYQYTALSFDFSDLSELNCLASNGWRVVYVTQPHVIFGAHSNKSRSRNLPYVALMERSSSVVESR